MVLTVIYRHDYNIVSFSKKIEQTITNNRRSSDDIKSDIDLLKYRIKNTHIMNDKFTMIGKLNKLKEELDDRVNNTHLRNYLQEIEPILNEYMALPKINSKIEFGLQDRYEDITPERSEIITRFFKTVNKYAEVDAFKQDIIKNTCPNCDIDISSIIAPADGQILICVCGLHIDQYVSHTSDNHTSDYKDRENFEKMFNNYQGLEDITLPSDLESKLDKYYTSIGQPTGREIRMKRERGETIGLRYRSLRTALGKIGYSNLYDHIWLVAHEYWDMPLADVQHLRDVIMRDYDITEAEFKKIRGKDRKSSLNTKWRLSRQLQMRGHKPIEDAFKEVETRDIVEYYEKTWEQMCIGANDSEIVYIKSL